jgi:hypothetical protein
MMTADIDIWADKLMDRFNSICVNDEMTKFSMMRAHIKDILMLYGQSVTDHVCQNFTKSFMENLPDAMDKMDGG